jgi:hypothetical protein
VIDAGLSLDVKKIKVGEAKIKKFPVRTEHIIHWQEDKTEDDQRS